MDEFSPPPSSTLSGKMVSDVDDGVEMVTESLRETEFLLLIEMVYEDGILYQSE